MKHKERVKEIINKIYDCAKKGDSDMMHFFEHLLEGYFQALVDLGYTTSEFKTEIMKEVDETAFDLFLGAEL